MSIRSKFKVDPKLVIEGKWFGEGFYDPNKDGSQPKFCIARVSAANPKYAKAVSDDQERNGNKELGNIEANKQFDERFACVIMVGWEHFQPEDDGNEVAYSYDNVLKIIRDPQWAELYLDWKQKSLAGGNYLAEQADTARKNS